MTMLVSMGGQERTESKYASLLSKAGFRVTNVVPTSSAASIVGRDGLREWMWVGFGSGTDSCTAAELRGRAAMPHSITSSARASSEGGTSRPSAFAVLRLITSLNLVGSCNRKLCRLGTLQYAIDLRGELGSGGSSWLYDIRPPPISRQE